MQFFGTASVLRRTPDGWEDYPVSLAWLKSVADWRFLNVWRRSLRRDATVAARDSYEYALLACKRWRFLHKQALTPGSLTDLKGAVKRNPAQEVGFTLALHPPADRDFILGIAFVRRSWANNLILEFLAGAPANADEIKGTGSILMQALARVAGVLKCAELWGECTALSRGFYITTKRRATTRTARNQEPEAITDRFQFIRPELRALVKDSSVRLYD